MTTLSINCLRPLIISIVSSGGLKFMVVPPQGLFFILNHLAKNVPRNLKDHIFSRLCGFSLYTKENFLDYVSESSYKLESNSTRFVSIPKLLGFKFELPHIDAAINLHHFARDI